MPVSTRTRFEIFKRDDFQCKYCGRRSPEVVLEVDHIVPSCEGGTDDSVNLTTSCWDCNRGKAGVSLDQVMTGEDPHDRAIELLEKERQLREYNHVVRQVNERVEEDTWALARYWNTETGAKDIESFHRVDFSHLKAAVKRCPMEKIREFMDLAIMRNKTYDMRYVCACVRSWNDVHEGTRTGQGWER
jgi:hypothetical protein